MAYSRKFFERKIKFLRKHSMISQAVFSGYYSQAIKTHRRMLVILARKELHYSDKTVGSDILHGLGKAWKEIKDDSK